MSFLSKIQNAGFTVELSGDSFEITPAKNLTQTQRDFLKTHKAEIIAELKIVKIICYSPSGQVFEVEASSPEHAEFLKRMNPPPMNKELTA